ncbi:MAG: helix-turn-helix domain-containing protein [Symploca sp. SIO2E9]|nr:helix-turn-helix domain-containing protein [Symploca sp. SIO2E9]
MKKPRPLSERELYLIELYSNCQLGMTPQQFYAKWDVTHEIIAWICSRSLSTVRFWFVMGKNHRPPQPHDLRNLALMDFLLEHFEEIPEEWRNLLCLSVKRQEGK